MREIRYGLTIDKFNCVTCGARALEIVEGFSSLPRVTSDTKPWPAGGKLTTCRVCGTIQKLPDTEWLEEIARIYGDYTLFHISAGVEQPVFTGATATPRSQLLLDRVLGDLQLPATGRMLDIGCGNGAALVNFARALPDWRFSGSELTDKVLSTLRALPNFDWLYTEPLTSIEARFTLVSMIHSLEHMLHPLEALEAASGLLESGGGVMVQVPDVETSPFDLLVADHLTHFSRRTLADLGARAGLVPVTLVNDFVPKEVTFLARRGRPSAVPPDPDEGRNVAESTVRWLADVFEAAAELANGHRFGIFGTAVAGMALYGALRDQVSFFVDEDVSRIGRDYDGRPVLSAQDAPSGAVVFVPFAPEVAARVAQRLSGLPAQFVATPPVDHERNRTAPSRN